MSIKAGLLVICVAVLVHVMEVSGFNSLLHLYETEDTALAAFA